MSDKKQCLKIFIGEGDRHEGLPLYEWIVTHAKLNGLSGATVFRGIMGFGANSNIKSSKILSISTDLPIIVEIIDSVEKIEQFLPVVDKVVNDGMVTRQDIEVVIYRHDSSSK